MLKKQANNLIGGLSNPSKMPCKGYSLPAHECHVGSKLRSVENSTCSNCYALKGRYVFPNVQSAQYRRLETISNPQWVPAMVTAIGNTDYFRWHDSGDIQSADHLANIVAVAERLPRTKFWLPTREIKIVRQYVQSNIAPVNLTIRISATKIDSTAARVAINWHEYLPTSTVHDKKPPIGFECPAPQQGGHCADCRACWDNDIDNVSYKRH